MIVVVDNTTKTKRFLPKLLAYLDTRKVTYVVVRTLEELQRIPKNAIDRFILSGSSSNLHDMTVSQYLMNVASLQHGAPVLGICFGAQFMQVYYGGQLKPLSRLYCENLPITLLSQRRFVNVRFCNHFSIKNVATKLQALATYRVEDEKLVCMFKHKTLPHVGILFHPEHSAHTHEFLDDFMKVKHRQK